MKKKSTAAKEPKAEEEKDKTGQNETPKVKEPPPGRLYTIKQAAPLLGYSASSLKVKIKEGKIPTYRPHPGGRHYITEEDIKAIRKAGYSPLLKRKETERISEMADEFRFQDKTKQKEEQEAEREKVEEEEEEDSYGIMGFGRRHKWLKGHNFKLQKRQPG